MKVLKISFSLANKSGNVGKYSLFVQYFSLSSLRADFTAVQNMA